MSGTTPTTLGKYQIIREIARSNDIVYEAYDPLMNRRVALKELSIPGGSSSQQLEERKNRFVREARAAGSLTHGNIVTIFEFGEDGGRYFIAMEYLDGRTLRNELDTAGFLQTERALTIIKQVLRGLEFAHQHGVIHRDIKPENIQLLESGQVKLTDFGIARLTFEPNITMDGQVFGTPSYMSPEQVVGKEIDQRSDLFSAGVVLYEMLSGQKPFGGDSVIAITHAIVNSQPMQPEQMNYAVWQIVSTALDKSPQMRYSSATEMIAAVDVAIDSMKSGDPVVPSLPANSGQMPSMTMNYGQPPPTYQYNPYPGVQPGGQYAPPPPPQPGYSQVPYSQVPYGQPQYAPPGYGAPPPPGGHGQYLPHGFQTPYQPGPGGFPQVPIYYPPPPRQPMFKPETKAFMAKFLLALLAVAAVFGLILKGISSISTAIEKPSSASASEPRGDSNGADNQPNDPADSSPGFDTPAATNSKPTPIPSGPSKSDIAGAKRYALDGDNQAGLALEAKSSSDQMAHWEKASQLWQQALFLADKPLERQIRSRAFKWLYDAASSAYDDGRRKDAINLAYKARDFALPGTTEDQQAVDALSKMGR